MSTFLLDKRGFIIFGWGNRYIKNIGPTLIQKCSICAHTSHFLLARARDWFTLFFIPIFPYETTYFLECPICHNGFEIEEEKDIKRLKQIAELIEMFNNKEITKKEANKQYDILTDSLGKPKKKKKI